MVDKLIRNTTKKSWLKFSIYINIILFIIVAIFLYFLINDSIDYGQKGGSYWMFITRDIAFIAVAISLIFFQFFRNIYIIMRRSL
jgi:hypothetical protein